MSVSRLSRAVEAHPGWSFRTPCAINTAAAAVATRRFTRLQRITFYSSDAAVAVASSYDDSS